RGLKVSAKKTTFYARELKYCGRVLTRVGAKFDQQYIDTVLRMGKPITVGELRSYLATVNWLRLAIPRFAEVVEPLQAALTKGLRYARAHRIRQPKNLPVIVTCGWGAEQDAAFERVCHAVANTVTLGFPDDSKVTCVWSDASGQHYAGLVTQTSEDQLALPVKQQEHVPLAFVSGSFRDSSSRWNTTEKEGYGLLATCERTEYLVSRAAKLHVFTDHNNLVFLFDPKAEGPCASKSAGDRVERWRVTMSRYNFEIHHVPGEVHVVADMFSRWAHPEFDRGAITPGVADAGAANTGELQEGAARMVSSREAVTADAELLRFDPTDFPSLGDIRQAQLEHVSLADRALFGLKEDITNRVLVNDAGQIFVPDAR
ncbi:RNase H-like domain-containing protein, partial [Silvimonas sp.]|uniref:RNase H-like domain-containing protein n=1 Tax=Silvimonas sp. TaxID=2650811 RepID=UPI00283DE68A